MASIDHIVSSSSPDVLLLRRLSLEYTGLSKPAIILANLCICTYISISNATEAVQPRLSIRVEVDS